MLLHLDLAGEIHALDSTDLEQTVEAIRRRTPGSVVRVWSPSLVADLDLDALEDLDRRRRPRLEIVR